MLYFDYSATTKPLDEVLETFTKVSKEFVGNPNSLHSLGVESKNLIDASTRQIAEILNVQDDEIIYTSGSSESNNLAIKGISEAYQNRGKHIITTPLEHSSIYGPLGYLQKKGYEVSFCKLKEDGTIDLEHLDSLIRKDTILVSIALVNSELGVRQPIEEIGERLQKYDHVFFHVDATQAIGKINIDFSNVDLFSFSAHKFFGIKGIGALIKKKNVRLEPLIHGGKSTTKYRSGTPAPALIASLAKALRLAYENFDSKLDYVTKLNQELKQFLSSFDQIALNTNDKCIPHILNFSVLDQKPETFLHALEEKDIFISTQSACSTANQSSAVYAFTKDEKKASSSLRISLSYQTTKEEIEQLKKGFSECYQKRNLK